MNDSSRIDSTGNTTIHPELVKIGKTLKRIIRPNKFVLRLLLWASNRTPDATIKGFQNDTYMVKRTRGKGDIRVRVYRPENSDEDLPVLLYFHGGGYCVNSPEAAHNEIQFFLKACPCVVIAPNYTKSLRAPYPAAIDDCEDTLDWLLAKAETLKIRTDKLIIGGHSAGGGLTVSLLMRIKQRGDVSVAFQMPIYPMIDHRSATESARDNHMPVWNTKLNKLAWKLYLGDKHGTKNIPVDAAPATTTDYRGLPPAATLVGNLDPFLDETRNYVRALQNAGVEVQFKIYDKCFHAFDLVAPDSTPSKAAIEFTQRCFREAVDKYSAPQPS